jgi:hypothetical protein
LFLPKGDGVNMRKPATIVAPGKPAVPAADPNQASVRLVCLALTLAVVVLAFRIASIW